MFQLNAEHDLAKMFVERIQAGLGRKSISKPSEWAMKYRIMGDTFPGPWTFRYHPWLREMHDTKSEHNCGQKCAQVGYSETMLNTVFYTMDIENVNCLYVLPNKTPDAKDFSASRFDPALELSPYIGRMFTNVNNIGHKQAGATNLYIRGSQSRSGLKSVPCGLVVLDERDEMNKKNVALAMERTSGQRHKKIWEISTPTIPGKGINTIFAKSTQEHFFFPCPSCSKQIEFTFPACINITAEDVNDPSIKDSHYICPLCKVLLPHEAKPDFLEPGQWVAKSVAAVRGFYVNQMYSSTVSPVQLATKYLNGQFDPASEQEFYNSALGLPHTVKGAKVTDEIIDGCIENFNTLHSYNETRLITMGVDVGARLHIEIDEWDILHECEPIDINIHARPRCIWYGTVPEFQDLTKLMADYSVRFCILDANPERRAAYNFVLAHRGRAKICFYGNGVQGRSLTQTQNIEESVTVDRTSWLDLSMGRYHRGKQGILLPKNIDLEYRMHIKALARSYYQDKNGNSVARYEIEDSAQDHYAHARNYSEIALFFAASAYTGHTTLTKKDMTG